MNYLPMDAKKKCLQDCVVDCCILSEGKRLYAVEAGISKCVILFFRRTRQMNYRAEEVQKCVQEYLDSYALKVCGCNQYLLEKFPLSQYKVSTASYLIFLVIHLCPSISLCAFLRFLTWCINIYKTAVCDINLWDY